MFGCFRLSHGDFSALDTAIETTGIKVEYNAASRIGSIHVYSCEQCTKSNYSFINKPIIIKKGNVITFEVFLSDFWNAKYPTLILDNKELNVLKVIY